MQLPLIAGPRDFESKSKNGGRFGGGESTWSGTWVLGGVKRESGKWRVESGRGVVFYAASEWPWPNGNGWLLRAQWKHFPARRYF